MADLSFVEKNKLEKLFGMNSGYVLSFSDRTFQEFVADSVAKDIYDQKYNQAIGSKANRLRGFWKKEANYNVGKLIKDLIAYAASADGVTGSDLRAECERIAQRLMQGGSVPELDAITPNVPGRTFEALAKSVRDAIDNNEPENGLDRLHTFVTKYLGAVCNRHGIKIERGKPLHSMMGEYVKKLRADGKLESQMTERILKSSISTLEAFNDVRNEQSFAHDNELLNYNESLLIFNHVAAAIRFIESIEGQDSAPDTTTSASTAEKDIPF